MPNFYKMNYFDRKITPSVIENLKPNKVVVLLGSRRTENCIIEIDY
jgi:hypothetical protein